MKNLPKRLLQLLILLIPFYFLRFNVGPIPSTVLEVGIYLIFLIFLFSGNLKFAKKEKYIIPALIFVLFTLVAALVDPDKIRGLGLWKGYFFDGFLVYLMFLSLPDVKGMLEAVFYSGVLTGALSLILFFTGVKTSDGRLLDLDRLSANYLAMFLTPIAVLGFFQCLKNRKWFDFIFEALIIVALVMTYSRGILIALIGAAIIFVYYLISKKTKPLAIGLLIVMLGAFFAGSYLIFKPDWSDHARKATSSNIRYYIWKTSIEIIKEKPILGVGLGNYQDYFSALTKDRVNFPEFISPEALTAHNLYLHLYLTGGVLAFLSFIYLLYSSRFYSLRNLSIGLAVFAILFYGLVDTPLYRNDLAILIWTLLGLCSLIDFKHA